MEDNPYKWPSLDNLGVMMHKSLTSNKRYTPWWLQQPASDSTTTQWHAYEKLDGTNVGMIASTGSLLGRHFRIADDATTYQSVSLANIRAHVDDAKKVKGVLLELLPQATRSECQVVLYGELLCASKHGYHERSEQHQSGDWFIFGAGIAAKEESLADIRTCLLQHGLAAKKNSGRVYIFLTDSFTSLLQRASQGRLRTPQRLCSPCTSLCDIATLLESQLTGDAARSTEGAILVGIQNQQLVDILKYKTGHADDSLSAEKLQQLLQADNVTEFEAQTLKLIQAAHAVATAHMVNQKQAGQKNASFQEAFYSALTKLDAVSVWSSSKEKLDQAISYITAQVKADLVLDETIDKEVKALETQVKKAVGKAIAASKKAAGQFAW